MSAPRDLHGVGVTDRATTPSVVSLLFWACAPLAIGSLAGAALGDAELAENENYDWEEGEYELNRFAYLRMRTTETKRRWQDDEHHADDDTEHS